MKILKIVIINIFIIIGILVLFEVYIFRKWCYNELEINRYISTVFNPIPAEEYFDKLYRHEWVADSYTNEFRRDENPDSDKKPILLMGCSFTYGDELQENQTLSAKLGEITGRPIYNRAGKGWGLSHFLFQIKKQYVFDNIPEPEYLIYIYITDHWNRLNRYKCEPPYRDLQPKYVKVNNSLIEKKPHLFELLYIYQNLEYHNAFNPIPDNSLIKLYFETAADEIQKHWNNTKFVVLIYPTNAETKDDLDAIKREISSEKYRVINAHDITDINLADEKYKINGWHPTSEVWELFTKDIVKALNL